MRKTALIFCLGSLLFAQSTVEIRVLQNIQKMMAQQGRVVFSDLYNSDQFSAEEKAFLARLYEIFFQIPGFLKTEFESTGKVPTRSEMAASFGISTPAVELLLTVMASDPRMPSLFSRHPENREIQSLHLENIDVFVRARGNQVRVTQWEGKAVPAFELATLDGQKISSADLAGKNILIYFWFTGCPPCVRIAPLLADLHRQYGGSDFQVIGFNADQVLELSVADEERNEHLKKAGVTFLNAHLDPATRQGFGGVNIFPTLFLIKSDGTIFHHLINYQDRATLERAITELLTSSRSSSL